MECHVRKIDLTNFRVATSGTVREVNRRIMLNLIRQHQPVSRADLARHSGLQRSTVSAIVEQLIAERWVLEGATHDSARGRKPTSLFLNKQRAGIFGIDVHPAFATMALAHLDGRFLAQETLVTSQDPDAFVEQIQHCVGKLMRAHPELVYEGIGVSLPGRVDLSSQRLVFAPNLGWPEYDLKSRLEAATGLSVELENAANACALSEFWFGNPAAGLNNLIAVTVSEGIGTGIILNGQLVRGGSGRAGEFGHIALNEEGPKCRCGNRGCWEMYASNSAALRFYQELAPDSRPRTNPSGAPPSSPSLAFDGLLELAQQGDRAAVTALERMAHYLGVGISMLITGLAPEVIMVVGDVTRVWDRVGPIVDAVVQRHDYTHARTRIAASNQLALPRLRGIIALVLQKRFAAPLIA
jgi:predicted NBD/HSP70 family sugar kinase